MILSVFSMFSLMSSPALAGAAQDCVTGAATNHPGLMVELLNGTTPLVPAGGDLSAAFDAIAEHTDEASLQLSYNGPAEEAFKEAISCISGAQVVSLAALWVNEHHPELTHQTHALAVDDGVTVETYSFTESMTCGDSIYAMLSNDNGGCGAWVLYKIHDGKKKKPPEDGPPPIGGGCRQGDCTGTCDAVCDPDGSIYCSCSGAGMCEDNGFSGSITILP